MTIAANAGIDGAIVIGKLIEQDDISLGYDAARGLFCLTMYILKLCGSKSVINSCIFADCRGVC